MNPFLFWVFVCGAASSSPSYLLAPESLTPPNSNRLLSLLILLELVSLLQCFNLSFFHPYFLFLAANLHLSLLSIRELLPHTRIQGPAIFN